MSPVVSNDARPGADVVPRPPRHDAWMRASLCVVVPCFNEELGIERTTHDLLDLLRGVRDTELIVVDDGSTDGTPGVLARLADAEPRLTVITHAVNQGYGGAIKTGMGATTKELVAITDADGTYPNERLPDLVNALARADMAVGARIGADVTYSRLRRLPKAFMIRYVRWLTRAPVPDMNSGLRVFRAAAAAKYLPLLPDGFSFTTTITIAMHMNRHLVTYVPVGYAKRVGRSKIRPVYDTLNFMSLILRTGMYFAPLRVFFPVAAVACLAGTLSALYDAFVLRDMTDKTLILLGLGVNAGMFALLADLIDRRMRS